MSDIEAVREAVKRRQREVVRLRAWLQLIAATTDPENGYYALHGYDATDERITSALKAMDEDLRERLVVFDGGPQLLSWEQAHRHHAAEPYIACPFCRGQFVPASEVEEARRERDQQERFKWRANAQVEELEASLAVRDRELERLEKRVLDDTRLDQLVRYLDYVTAIMPPVSTYVTLAHEQLREALAADPACNDLKGLHVEDSEGPG